VPTLLSLIGSKTYSLLKDLLLPEKPADKNFDEILSNQQIQKRLLAESKLKFSKAVDIAVAMETATRDATEIHSECEKKNLLVLTN
jgi:hypothetical protein